MLLGSLDTGGCPFLINTRESFEEFPTMLPTPHPPVNQLLQDLLSELKKLLGADFAGLYLYGSLVTGDYDPEISDVDLLAAVTHDLNPAEFTALETMHLQLMSRAPQWDNRIEIAYVSLKALRTFKTERSQIGIISPGEPFNLKMAGIDWLMNWYVVREKGITLWGPPPAEIIAPVSKEEFIDSLRDHARSWQAWIDKVYERPYQSYVILTLCRALYAVVKGESVSKIQAAAWAQQELPQWAGLIANALIWRKDHPQNTDHTATLPLTRQFVSGVVPLILKT